MFTKTTPVIVCLLWTASLGSRRRPDHRRNQSHKDDLDRLNNLNGLVGLNDPDGLDGLDDLDGLDGLDDLDVLDGPGGYYINGSGLKALDV